MLFLCGEAGWELMEVEGGGWRVEGIDGGGGWAFVAVFGEWAMGSERFRVWKGYRDRVRAGDEFSARCCG